MVDLQQRRQEAEAELEKLVRARGVAQLDGVEFTSQSRINNLQHRLEALDAAEGEQAERARAEAEKRRLARLAQLRAELSAVEEERLMAVERCEMSCRNLVDALNAVMAITAREAALCHTISDGSAPSPLAANSTATRMSHRIGSVLGLLTYHSRKYGGIEWQNFGMLKPSHSWVEAEAAALRNHLEPLVTGVAPQPEVPQTPLLQIEDHRDDDEHADN